MKILLTGTTGYIGKRLLPLLLEKGHEVICCVRDKKRFSAEKYLSPGLKVIEVNFLDPAESIQFPEGIDAAYYLIHSMASGEKSFEELEKRSAEAFRDAAGRAKIKQVIYLSGIVNEETLSKHLISRKNVENILAEGNYSLTTLRAGIIVGSGSASFEIIRDLVEKLPLMITPRWLNTRTQPIAIRNVVEYLVGVLLRTETYGRSFDIGGPDILTYKQMLLRFAKIRGLKRFIVVVPVMTPRLSSYWLYFVTAVSYSLAVNLVNSMKIEIICRQNNLKDMLGINLIDYDSSIRLAFDKIEQNQVISSWSDALTSNILNSGIMKHMEVPQNGCFKDERKIKISSSSRTLDKIWAIGGNTGWYYANWLWSLRGFADKIFGGVGLRRGRKDSREICAGETLDFWRVLLADRKNSRLLLYAEMKLPGEAWLEFKITNGLLQQTATFRPLGLLGRFYWYSVYPFHGFIFRGMIKRLAE
ncbi:MAG: SDR family oxidoreductase [Ignavibacteria bacterium]|nr:SDR family oxidoreductase [Ignavibacteria bacterium]